MRTVRPGELAAPREVDLMVNDAMARALEIQWWREPAARQRFTADLIAGELARLRPGRPLPGLPWTPELDLETGLGVDSLERVHLATALGEAIGLYRSGIDDSLLTRRSLGEWTDLVAASFDAAAVDITFRTSGSTGQPKWCVHALAELAAETLEHARRLLGVRRVISAVPSHHIYGFIFTLLLPVRLGVEVIDIRAHAPARLASLLRPGDLIIGHPDYWSAVSRSVGRFGPGATGVTSTAPCPPQTAQAVLASGLDRLVEIYGSSETAGIGWRDDSAAPFELLECWRRAADERELVRTGVAGVDRSVRLPDRVIWEGDRRLRPAGRTEGAVQIGGVNVIPAAVAAALRACPGVAQAAVRLMRPHEGDRLKAFIVPEPPDADLTELAGVVWGWIDTRLTAPERPKSLVFGPALPVGELGKLADWPLPGSEESAR